MFIDFYNMIDSQSIEIRKPDTELIKQIAKGCRCSNLLAHLLINRGLKTIEQVENYFHADSGEVYAAETYPGVAEAAELIVTALKKEEKIFVCGDYDVDGITAASIIVLGLRNLNAQVECHLPHRFSEGFGLSQEGVEAAVKYGASLLITVDCGSSSAANVSYARNQGLKVIVTDHHQIEGEAAEPDVFVNANLEGHDYPFTKLCGAGVAWKLLCAVYKRHSLPEPRRYLDMVALATLCDMVPMKGENRVLTMLGMPILASLERPCFKALAEGCKISPEAINAQSMSFSIGPKINACGRMDSPQCALDLMLAQNIDVCRMKVSRLLELSQERHKVEQEVFREIEEILDKDGESKRSCIFVYGTWHKGILGLSAQRLMDTYRVPVFVGTDIDDNGQIMGSGRAPEGINLLDILNLCTDCLDKYGGHANAGGFTLKAGYEAQFAQALRQACRQLDIKPPKKKVDCLLPIHKLDMELIRELDRLEPTGKENEKPLFLAKDVHVVSRLKPMGAFGTSVSMQVVDDNFPLGKAPIKAIAFNKVKDLATLDIKNCTISFLYNVEENIFRGRRELQITIRDFVAPDPRTAALLPAEVEQNEVFSPFEEADRIVNNLDRQRYLASVFAHSRISQRLVDSRQVLNKKLYIERLCQAEKLEDGSSVLVVTDMGAQFADMTNCKLAKIVTSLETYVGSQADKVAFYQAEPYKQVILAAPPLQIEFFNHPCIVGAKQIHVLFDYVQLFRLKRKLKVYALDREIMKNVYCLVMRLTKQGKNGFKLTENQIKVAAQELKLETITLRRALKVLEQLNLLKLDSQEKGLLVGHFLKPESSEKLDLQSSALYRSASELLDSFSKVQRHLSGLALEDDFLA